MQQHETIGKLGVPSTSPQGKRWYPLHTRYQCEKRIDVALRSEGFESFAPMRRQIRRWSDRTKVVDAPLFPGYLFVHMEAAPELLVKVLRIPGLVRFVNSGRELVAVPGEEIEAVRALVNSNATYEQGPFPAIGEKVRVRGGCLDGIEGVMTAQNGRGEIVISVGAIARSLVVPVSDYQVERLELDHGPPAFNDFSIRPVLRTQRSGTGARCNLPVLPGDAVQVP